MNTKRVFHICGGAGFGGRTLTASSLHEAAAFDEANFHFRDAIDPGNGAWERREGMTGPDDHGAVYAHYDWTPKNDPAVAHRARLVREAIASLSNEPGCGWLFGQLAQSASDEALAKLGRLVR